MPMLWVPTTVRSVSHLMSKKIAIIYGWGEGAWEGKQFRDLLVGSGFSIVDKPVDADIVFTHSLGCYLVPGGLNSRKIFLVGLPYWPGRGSFKSVLIKLFREIKYHRRNQDLGWWLAKILHNVWYILTRPSASYYALSKKKIKYLPEASKNRVFLVRPVDDTFCHPDIMKLLPKNSVSRFIGIDGAHDDCWVNPRPYIDLLLKEI